MTIGELNAQQRAGQASIAISVEGIAYILLFVAALGLRWIQLGDPMLSDVEAEQAFAALRVLNPTVGELGTIRSPIILFGTIISLGLGETSSATARFFPMLIGTLLVFSPLILKPYLGRLATFFTVFALTISPGAVASSRQLTGVGLMMLATIISIYAIGQYTKERTKLWAAIAGAATAIMLLSDYMSLAVLITMLLAVAFAVVTDDTGSLDQQAINDGLAGFPFATFSTALLLTLGLLGSAFFITPDGLRSLSGLITIFFEGVFRAGRDLTNAGLTFVTYEMLLFVFGVVGQFILVRSTDLRDRILTGWGIAALLVLVLYQGARPEHAMIAIIPMALLTGVACTYILNLERRGPAWVSWAHMLGIVAVFGIMLLFLLAHLRTPNPMTLDLSGIFGSDVELTYFPFLFIDLIILLLLVMTLFFSAGWFSLETALFSTCGGTFAILAIVAIGLSGNLAFTSTTNPAEVLRPHPPQPSMAIMVETLEDISKATVGNSVDIPLTVQSSPDSALAWALLPFPNTTFVETVNPGVATPAVITSAAADPALGAAYLGQEFVITRSWVPREASISEFLQWWVYRIAPTESRETTVILWIAEESYQLDAAVGPAR